MSGHLDAPSDHVPDRPKGARKAQDRLWKFKGVNDQPVLSRSCRHEHRGIQDLPPEVGFSLPLKVTVDVQFCQSSELDESRHWALKTELQGERSRGVNSKRSQGGTAPSRSVPPFFLSERTHPDSSVCFASRPGNLRLPMLMAQSSTMRDHDDR